VTVGGEAPGGHQAGGRSWRRRAAGPPSPRAVTWSVVGRLTLVVTAVSVVVVVGGGTALWLMESGHPSSSLRSWGDAVWWALSTMTTVGYGDLIPVTTAGRLVAALVMVVGVAVIGAVAAVVALTVARQVAREEEQLLEAQADVLERRLEAHLARMEAQLRQLDALLHPSSPAPADDVRSRRTP
jgi:voltage-gated potassium channel